MVMEQKDIPIIEAWIKGKLHGDDLLSFEKRMTNDAEWAEEVKIYRYSKETFSDKERLEFRKKIEIIQVDIDKEESNKKGLKWYFIFIPIALLGLIAWYWISSSPINTPGTGSTIEAIDSFPEVQDKLLLDDTLKPNENTMEQGISSNPKFSDKELIAMADSKIFDPLQEINLRSETEKQNNLLNKAISDYRQGSYRKAIQKANELMINDSLKSNATLLLGLAHFRLHEYIEAYAAFQQVLALSELAPDPLEWNILMTQLAQKNRSEKTFHQLLEKILSDKQHSYYDKAFELKKVISN